MLKQLRTIAAVAVMVSFANAGANETTPSEPKPVAATEAPELIVGSSTGINGAEYTTEIKDDTGKLILHGMQLYIDKNAQVKRIDVYNRGRLERRSWLHSNAYPFVDEDYDAKTGIGSEVVSDPTSKMLYMGQVKDGKLWEGDFLDYQPADTYVDWQFVVRHYKGGIQTGITPLKPTELGLPNNKPLRTSDYVGILINWLIAIKK